MRCLSWASTSLGLVIQSFLKARYEYLDESIRSVGWSRIGLGSYSNSNFGRPYWRTTSLRHRRVRGSWEKKRSHFLVFVRGRISKPKRPRSVLILRPSGCTVPMVRAEILAVQNLATVCVRHEQRSCTRNVRVNSKQFNTQSVAAAPCARLTPGRKSRSVFVIPVYVFSLSRCSCSSVYTCGAFNVSTFVGGSSKLWNLVFVATATSLLVLFIS